jgi:HSP20 family protein
MLWSIDPWRELERVQRDMDALFTGRGLSPGASTSFPLTNVYEDRDSVTVVVELPGMKKDKVTVTLHNGVLTVSGERTPREVDDKVVILRQERSEGAFEKTIRMPVKVNDNGIAASFKEGILTIRLPKAEDAKPKAIPIVG